MSAQPLPTPALTAPADRRLADQPRFDSRPPAESVPFAFDGRDLVGRAGEPLTAALLANGVATFRTMPRSGEPRGGYCLVGRCTDCLVQVEGAPNVRACVTPLRAGLRVATQHGLGEFGAAFSPLENPMPVGADGSAPGAARPAGERGRSSPPNVACQVAVVGGGPAGLAAAIAATEIGARVVLLDEWPELGGRLRYEGGEVAVPWQPASAAVEPPVLADRLVGEAAALGVDLRPSAVAWGAFEGNRLAVAAGGDDRAALSKLGSPIWGTERPSAFVLRPEVLILATGSTDRPWSFAGATLPGVWSARALQILVNRDRVLPGRRCAVVGAGPEAAAVAATVRGAGAEVVAVADPARAMVSAEGRGRVRAVLIDGVRSEVDLVVVAVGRQPDAALALMAGAACGFDPSCGGHAPTLDDRLGSSLPGLLVAGDAAGPTDPATALAEGRLAGLSAASLLGLLPDAELAAAQAAFAAVAGDRLAARRRLAPTYVQPYR